MARILVFNGSPKGKRSDTMHITRAFLRGMEQAAPQQKKEAEARPQAEPEADSDAVDLDQLADEILAETETVPQEQKQTAPEQTAERKRQPRKTVSLFDSDYEFDDVPKTSRFESLKFGDDYDLKDDPEMASGGRKKR